jgi:hypothetical protein
MANISLTDEQSRRDERMKYAESQLKRLCKEKGLDWDFLSEEEKEAFVDDLIHEDR